MSERCRCPGNEAKFGRAAATFSLAGGRGSKRRDRNRSIVHHRAVIDTERTDLVAFPSLDYERTRTFYRDTLGLRESASSSERYVEFETGNVSLGFYTPREEFRPSSGIVALRVADVADSRARLEAAGVDFVSETIDSSVCHMAIFKDPDGNLLMLHRRYAPLPR